MNTPQIAERVRERIEVASRLLRTNPRERVHLLSFEGISLAQIPDGLPEGITHLCLNGTDIRTLDGATLPKSLRVLEAVQTKLHSITNLDQLPVLQDANFAWSTYLDRFEGPLPKSLVSLTLRNSAYLHTLPPLGHTKLHYLTLTGCHALQRIPDLPSTVITLSLNATAVRSLPYLPDTLVFLEPSDALRSPHPALRTPHHHAVYYRREQHDTFHALAKIRFDSLHEELMAVAWHPDRVSKWLDHGEDVLDMMMGVSS